MRYINYKFYGLLNKHYDTLRQAHPNNDLVERWIGEAIRATQDNQRLFICTRCIVHWSEGGADRLQDGQIFKSFFDFRAELIKRDLDHLKKYGSCGGYDKVKFSVVGIWFEPDTQEVKPYVFTDRIDLGDGKYGIDDNIDLLVTFRKKGGCYVIPTTHDLKNLIAY